MNQNAGLSPKYSNPISAEKRASLLEESKWLKNWQWKMIQALAQVLDVYNVPPGHMLVEEGASHGWLGIVCEGQVRVLKKGDDGEQKEIAHIGAGHAFGEVSLIDKGLSSASIEVSQKLTMLVLTPEKFNKLIEVAPTLALQFVLKLAVVMSTKLRSTSSRLAEFLEGSS